MENEMQQTGNKVTLDRIKPNIMETTYAWENSLPPFPPTAFP